MVGTKKTDKETEEQINANVQSDVGGITPEAVSWAVGCHIVALVGLLGNGIGFFLGPLILWLIKKNDAPFIDEQGKEAVNFQLTMLIAAIITTPFVFIIIGIPVMIIIGVLAIVFPIIAAVQTSNGEHYRYPISIRFIK